MTRSASRRSRWTFVPATAAQWSDLAALFGERGACGGCWCMWPRLQAKDFARGKGAPNRRALRARVGRDAPPGILAYAGDVAVGWAAIAPRVEYRRLETSRVLAPVDDQEVWSVPCFFVAKAHRGQGLTTALLEAACRLARRHGARIVEGYPLEIGDRRQAAAFGWVGYLGAFTAAGFQEVARRSPTRPIVRRMLRAPARPDGPAAGRRARRG